jgi:hypothetical protein
MASSLSLLPDLFEQSKQLQDSWQALWFLKHSQYNFKHYEFLQLQFALSRGMLGISIGSFTSF